jgi:uncharacterized protein (TIGR03437 family)
MQQVFRSLICLVTMSLASAFGQGITLVRTGYVSSNPLTVAPGQVTTFFVTGLQTVLAQPQKAAGAPLPFSLAGLTVDILEASRSFTSIIVWHVPLLRVEQFDNCGGNGPNGPNPSDCYITAITAQVPVELGPGALVISTSVVIIGENGKFSKGFGLALVRDNLHVLTRCETEATQSKARSDALLPCAGVVTHADGSLVNVDSPAMAGETVVIYGFGLGTTSPNVRSGEASPSTAATLDHQSTAVQFDFRPNAMPSRPYGTAIQAPSFVGLTPGQVGLYQINVKLPDKLQQVPACSDVVRSNLTIDIGGISSFDGAAICVQPGA